MLSDGTQRRALPPERRNENIKYFISLSENLTHNLSRLLLYFLGLHFLQEAG